MNLKYDHKLTIMETTDKVIIIEDNLDICFFLQKILETVGLESSFAETLKESHCILQSMNPSSIFIDNSLPDGSGFENIPTLKELCPDSKIIAMTADSSFELKERALNDGANYYLEKPFTINQVLNVVLVG